MAAIIGAATASARRTVRCGWLISSPMKEAASGPVQAKAIVAQKIRSVRCRLGARPDLLNAVADPNFSQVVTPRNARSRPASQREIAPTLLSHLAMAIPRKFRYVARASPASANAMKYPEEALACALAREETYSALPAAKYRRPGKNGRLLV